MKFRFQFSPALFIAGVTLIIGLLVWLFQGNVRPPEKRADPLQIRVVKNDQVFGDFKKWLDQFSATPADQRAGETSTGLVLARERRIQMEMLIRDHPREALAHAVTLDVWKNLPPVLQNEVEEPFSALGNFRVLPVCGEGIPTRNVIRYAEIAGSRQLGSSVFGRRNALSTKENSPIQGIRLNGIAALREQVLHRLEPQEIAIAETLYPIANPLPDRDFSTGEPLGSTPVTTLSGGRIFRFSDDDSLATFENAIAALDVTPGPHSGAAVLFLAMPAAGTAGPFNLTGAGILNRNLENTWTETRKKVLMIRCDFTDVPDSPANRVVNQASYESLLNTTVSDDIRDFSYGKTWIEATVSTEIVRLPQAASYYTQLDVFSTSRNFEILADARAAYQALHPGTNFAAYDIVGIWFAGIGMQSGGVTYAGLAGGSDLWIQNSQKADIHVHELGHNYGIGHSSFWTPPVGSQNPVDPAGSYEEYGDHFDVMGSGPVPEGVFHAEAKKRLNWLASGDWADATAGGSGVYRIKRIDHPDTTGIRGLRITKSGNEYYWLNYRRLFSNSWLKAGANIVWEQGLNGRSWLIDTTPNTLVGEADRTDGSLAIGRTYSDPVANVHITTLARGGTSPGEYLDVQVNLGPFPGNSAPNASLNGPASIGARQTCIFTAQASDPNGDPLAFSWDFGQGFTFDNRDTASFAWNVGGTYTVKLTVSDMKGQSTVVTKTVTVSDPITTWTARANTSNGSFKALAASPSKVIAAGVGSSKGPVATSIDGITWTSTELGLNQHAYDAVWDGNKFLLAGVDADFSPPAPTLVGCVFTSPTANAGSWTRRIFSGPPLKGIAHSNGVTIAVGDSGTIRRSADGINWPAVASGTTKNLEGVAYGGGRWVVLGFNGGNGSSVVLTSPDGITWTDYTSGAGTVGGEDLRHIVWAQDRFLASGWYGKLRYSLNQGVSFQPIRTSRDNTPGLALGNGLWFAAGINQDASNTDIDLISTDGVDWTSLSTPSVDDRNAAIFFNNTFITAGNNQSIRQSAPIIPTRIGFTTWREAFYPDRGNLSGPNEDGDGDSLSNLLEYALGSSPVSASGLDGVAVLPQASLFSASPLLSDRVAMQFSLPEPAPADMIYVVEASSMLDNSWTPLASKTGSGSWTWTGGGTSRILLGTAAGGKVPVTVGDTQAASIAPTRFLRLRTMVNQ